MTIHKRIVLGMNNQRGFGYLIKQRHGATLTVIVYRIGETVNFGGDQIVKIANATQRFQLGQTHRQRARISLKLTRGIGFQQVKQVALIDLGESFVHMVTTGFQHERRGDDNRGINGDRVPFFCQQAGQHVSTERIANRSGGYTTELTLQPV